MEKMFHNIIFITGSLFFVFIILSLISGLLSIVNEPNETQVLDDGKYDSLMKLEKMINHCFNNNRGSHESNVCFKVKTDVNEKITESDIRIYVDGINSSLIHSVTINQNVTEVLIKYQDGQIFIEER